MTVINMQKIETLNNIAHEHLRITPGYSADMGDNVASTLTYVTEFSEVQKEYPILCRKVPESDEYQAIVFFGFEKGENLFLTDIDPARQKNPGWNADYVPAVMSRGPFSIGIHREIVDGLERLNPMVHIDVNHPKVVLENGRKLFSNSGGNTEYLNQISRTLEKINDGIALNDKMFKTFSKYELLESVVLDIEFQNQNKLKISGFETISLKRLADLNGAALEELNRSGFLQAAYFIAASLSNVRRLIDWKNRKLYAAEAKID